MDSLALRYVTFLKEFPRILDAKNRGFVKENFKLGLKKKKNSSTP